MDYGPHETKTYGRRTLNIEGYYRTFVPRVSPDGEFGNEDRKWRAQWLKDQQLKGADVHSPPTGSGLNQYQLEQIPEYRKARWNIFRRTLRAPMDLVESALIKTTGMHWTKARFFRNVYSYGWKGFFLFSMFSYHLIYRANDWEDKKNWKIYYQKPLVVPKDGVWPDHNQYKREKSDYWNQNFKQSELYANDVKATTKSNC